MPERTTRRSSLIRSTYALRALVTAITFTTFTGMSAFAATHLQNSAAPLKPSASDVAASPMATPAPTPQARQRTTTTGRVPTTTAAPRTRVHSS